MMLIKDMVKMLTDAGIEENEANVEIKLLLEYCANYTLSDIITGKKLSDEKLGIVEKMVKIRATTRKPIQYVIGLADFMGEKFIVNPSVLITRDETELLVRQAVEIINQKNYTTVMDMCTGSGCIACMIAKNTRAAVMGVDVSTEALHVAFDNMEKLELFNRATFRKSNLFEKINTGIFLAIFCHFLCIIFCSGIIRIKITLNSFSVFIIDGEFENTFVHKHLSFKLIIRTLRRY
jgi:release factor glutamine methyltransferase